MGCHSLSILVFQLQMIPNGIMRVIVVVVRVVIFVILVVDTVAGSIPPRLVRVRRVGLHGRIVYYFGGR